MWSLYCRLIAPQQGPTQTSPSVVLPRVTAYTAAACCCEKHNAMFTAMPAATDISAARSPSVVHGYFTQAFGIDENMSSQHLLGSRAQVQREPNGNSAEVSMNAVDNWQSDAQIALEHCCVLLFVDARQLRDDRSPWGYPSATWRHFK